MLVDSHCHLNFPDFRDDLDAVIERAGKAGVGVMQTICTGMEEFAEVRAIAERHTHIYCSVGVHPNESGSQAQVSFETLVGSCDHPKVIGIGETGLDYHYENSPRQEQQQSFRTHIAAARKTGLPLIVHTRDAEEDTVGIIREEMEKGAFCGLIHCFTSSGYLAEEVVKLGFYISVSGIVTFKSAGAIRDALKNVPKERLLVETDAPYLAPVPNRGKRNEPSFVVETNRMLAEIKGISEAEMAAVTTDNFFALFQKAARPQPREAACA